MKIWLNQVKVLPSSTLFVFFQRQEGSIIIASWLQRLHSLFFVEKCLNDMELIEKREGWDGTEDFIYNVEYA